MGGRVRRGALRLRRAGVVAVTRYGHGCGVKSGKVEEKIAFPFDSRPAPWQQAAFRVFQNRRIEIPMTKPELGVKRDCPNCGARFYDLNREPARCPKCGHEFVPEALLKPRKSRKEEQDAAESETEIEASEKETSLESADEEKTAAKSNRRPSMDDDDDSEEDGDELSDIDNLDVDLDDEEDEDSGGLLDDDDDNNDVTDIVKPTGGDDD